MCLEIVFVSWQRVESNVAAHLYSLNNDLELAII